VKGIGKTVACKQSATSYANGCRCEVCHDKYKTYKREYARRTRRPDSNWKPRKAVSPKDAQNHLKWLREQKVPLKDIWQSSGVDMTTLVEIREGRKKFIWYDTAAKILAVNLTDVTVFERVRTHILEVKKCGWDAGDISRACGVERGTIYAILNRTRGGVWPQTAKAIMSVDPKKPKPRR
jgi:hypothetical protein